MTGTITSLLWALALSGAAAAQTVRYVDDDAPPGGDGLTWETAYRFLQDALAEAASDGVVTEIHVAQGAYTPDREEANPDGTGDRDATFQLINGVALLGGYAGIGAPDPDDRDVLVHGTTLSGDLAADDDPDPIGSGFLGYDENSHHVVTASATDATARLDGFTIRGGHANGQPWPAYGTTGAGIINDAGSPTVTNCIVTGNLALEYAGGMENMYGSSPTVSNTIFTGNASGLTGGGLENFSGSHSTITNCTFSDNSAGWGAGIASFQSHPTVNGCAFTNNTADNAGGGMHNNGASPTVDRCTFVGNRYLITGGGGGGMININGHPIVTNCLFAGNEGPGTGAMANWDGGNPTVTNCSFVGNAINGMWSGSNSHPTASNCIFWDNTSGQIVNVSGSTTTVSYSDVQFGYPGTGNMNADPMFVDPANGDIRLSPSSPCIDAGDTSAVPVGVIEDLDGNPRFVDDPCRENTGIGDPPVDMGAYEFQDRSCDLDGSGMVGITDFLALLAAWGPCPAPCPPSCPADFDGDCEVGVTDFLILLANWG